MAQPLRSIGSGNRGKGRERAGAVAGIVGRRVGDEGGGLTQRAPSCLQELRWVVEAGGRGRGSGSDGDQWGSPQWRCVEIGVGWLVSGGRPWRRGVFKREGLGGVGEGEKKARLPVAKFVMS